ncbi:hypothetical protein RB195_016658 [Necator americanus]|uniref:Protein tweety homolog n=1 Tax=Necator americanus TaxID=51031 RepID=A0ABR1C4S7_NECAM
MSGKKDCVVPSQTFSEKSADIGSFYTFSEGFMKAVVGALDNNTKTEILNAVKSYTSKNVLWNYAWSNSVFLCIFLSSILVAFIIVLCFIVKLCMKCFARKKRFNRCFIVVFWSWASRFQGAHDMRYFMALSSADHSYFEDYSKAYFCSVNVTEEIVMKSLKKQHEPVYSSLKNYTKLVQAYVSSKGLLNHVLYITMNCNSSDRDGLKKYLEQKMNMTKHEIFLPNALATLKAIHTTEKSVKTIFSSYRQKLKQLFIELEKKTTNIEEKVADFIVSNEFSFRWLLVIRLILILPIVLILECLICFLGLIVYSISTFVGDFSTSGSVSVRIKCYRIGGKILEFLGLIAMPTSACFFAATGFLLYTGYSSVLVCNSFTDHNFDEYKSVFINFDTKHSEEIKVELREVFKKCQQMIPFYDAMRLKHLLPQTPQQQIRSAPLSVGVKGIFDSTLTEDLNHMLEHLEHLKKYSKVKELASDKCLGDNAQSLKKSLSQVERYTKTLRGGIRELNKLKSDVHIYKNTEEFTRNLIATVNDELHLHSIGCAELTAGVEVWRAFCYDVPPYLQGIFVVCGLTAIVSIHVFSAIFKAANFVMPIENSGRVSLSRERRRSAGASQKKEPRKRPSKDTNPVRVRKSIQKVLGGDEHHDSQKDAFLSTPSKTALDDDATELYHKDRLSDKKDKENKPSSKSKQNENCDFYK